MRQMNASMQTERFPYDTPPGRRSHRAVSPNGAVVAEIAEAFEHSMSNPTVGILRTSDGLVLPKCNPAFVWSNDSRYLAVPQWHRCFALFLRQRLVVVDVENRAVFASRFTAWLLQPKTFDRGTLEVLVSHSIGITWGWKEKALVIEIPGSLSEFDALKCEYK
jgi:hypothetical protein